MHSCEQLIIDIQETIRENGNNEITGPILQDVLVDMVYALCGEQQSFDELKMWQLLSAATPEQINVSHLSATDVAGMLTQAGYKLTDTTYALATDAVAGLLKTGYAASGRNYAVELDEDGRAFVNVPWTDKFDTYFGVDEDGNIYVKDNRGLWSNSFLSARGSDPEAGSGGGGGGLDVQAMWYALGQPTNEKINVSHIPSIGMDKVSGLTDALAGKLSGITGEMVTEALGYTPYDASQIGSASVKYAASAGKVAHALTINNDGGSSSASAKTYNGSASVTINIPTTLPASDVYDWAKQPDKPSYNFSEIGSKPTTLAGYGIKDGVNSAEAGGHLTASVSGHKLSVGVASGYAIPSGTQISLWDKIAALFAIDADGNVYVTGNRGFYGNSFISARGSDPGAGSGGGSGVDMESVWYALGQPTTEKINVSHIPALQQLSGTLTNAQLANSAISVAGVSVSLGGAVTTAQIGSALTGSGYKLTDTTYTLTKSGSTITLTGSNGSKTSVTDSNTTYTLGSFGITATAAEINKLDGLATTAKELGYVHGVTSNIQTQLNGKANTSALAAYALKDGSNASGTWPISVSGSSGKAAYLTSTYTGSGGLQPPSYFNGMGLKVNMMSQPSAYCDVIVVNGYGGAGSDVPYINALAFKKSSAAHGDVWHARGDYGGSSWGTWYKFLDEYNYAGILDSRYLQKSSYTASDILAKLKTVAGSGSGLDADLLDGTHKSGLLTALTSNTSTNLSLTVGGTVKTVAALYATYLGGQTLGGTRRGMTFLSSSFSAAGWYRVYTSSSGNSSSESEVLLHIGRNYYSPQNEHYSFSICVGYNGDISITQLSGVMGGHLITKIRVVWANSQKFYIDIYSAASSYNNTYGVTGQGYGTFSAFTSGASIPDGYAAYEFTTVDGCKSSGGFSTTGVEGRAIGFDGNSINLCAATGGWAMGIKTYHHDRATSFDHWVCGAYGDNGDNISYTYYGGTYASPAMVILPNKRVGIGTTAPTDRLHVIGTIRATTGIWSNGYVSAKGQDTTSDARYKRDVAALPAQAALSVLMRLRPSTWAWKDDGRRGAGFVAQEVLGVLPEAVREVGGGEDRHLALNYQMLHAYEVSMLQTHEERLTKLENEIKRIRHGS